MNTILWLDFETRSRCDLLTRGVYNYARDPSTEVLCMSYAFDDDPVRTWLPQQPFPEKIREHLADQGIIRAHNATFERLIFWYVICPEQDVQEPYIEQFYCTATEARANCMPGSLGDLARFAGTNMKKDYRGAQLIRWLSIPRPDGTFLEDDDLMREMVSYCEQDVRTMRAASRAMRPLSAEELLDYHVNERVNDLGIRVDLPLCRAGMRYAENERREIEARVRQLTDGMIDSVRSPKMAAWAYARVGDEARKLMTVYKEGEKRISADRHVRGNLLSLAENNPEEVPPDVADVVQCADDLWASSVAKFTRMASLADIEDHRVRGSLIFAGGSATGRAASYGLQVHNLSRDTAKEPLVVRKALIEGRHVTPTFGNTVTGVLKQMLRPAICPADGHVFVVADWASIEARVSPWLSLDPQAEETLTVFREGGDLYVREAMKLFACSADEVTKARRQIGKVAVLALGYGGGVKAFAAMARAYGVTLSETEIERTVRTWRRVNGWATRFWRGIELAYMRAVRSPGQEQRYGRITYLYDRQHLWYALPSGRVLCYPFAETDGKSVSYSKASWKPAAGAETWPRARLYGGLAVENVTQATANDVLRHALRELDDRHYPVVLHVHDEIVVEVPEKEASRVAKGMAGIMTASPAWAGGLPLAVDVKQMSRYGK